MGTKTYILDTTVLIEDPDIMYKLGNSLVVIPVAAIKEIDGLKRSEVGPVAQAARSVARTLDRLGSYGDLREGVKLSSGGVLKVYNGNEAVDGLASEADNRIVGAAVRLQRELGDVTLLTTDSNMRTVARVNGVKAEIIDVGGSYEKTVKMEDKMDKHRMEVERGKENKGVGQGKENPSINKEISTEKKIIYIIPIAATAILGYFLFSVHWAFGAVFGLMALFFAVGTYEIYFSSKALKINRVDDYDIELEDISVPENPTHKNARIIGGTYGSGNKITSACYYHPKI